MIKFNSEENNIFFSSDFHYGHKNICRGISNWTDLTGTRNFDTLKEMNQIIINGINNTVGKNDILFFIGDWSFGGLRNVWNLRKQINCETIYFILGNHDHHVKQNKILPNVVFDFENKIGDYNFGTQYNSFYDGKIVEHYKEVLINEETEEIRSNEVSANMIFEDVDNYMEIQIDSHKFILFHYPIFSWNNIQKDSIHLYGHTHANHINGGRSMDAGIDMAYQILGEYRPFSYWEIKNILKF